MGYCPFGIFVNAWDFTPSHKDFTSHTVHNIPIRFEFGDIVSTSIQEMILTVLFPRNTAYIASLMKVNDEIEFDVDLVKIDDVYVCNTILNVYRNNEHIHAATLPTIVTKKLSDIVRF